MSQKRAKQKQANEVFHKKQVFLKISQNSQGNTFARVSFLIQKETLAQVFPCEFGEIFKNICFTEHLWTNASDKMA